VAEAVKLTIEVRLVAEVELQLKLSLLQVFRDLFQSLLVVVVLEVLETQVETVEMVVLVELLVLVLSALLLAVLEVVVLLLNLNRLWMEELEEVALVETLMQMEVKEVHAVTPQLVVVQCLDKEEPVHLIKVMILKTVVMVFLVLEDKLVKEMVEVELAAVMVVLAEQVLFG
jgi:hypothetical protein